MGKLPTGRITMINREQSTGDTGSLNNGPRPLDWEEPFNDEAYLPRSEPPLNNGEHSLAQNRPQEKSSSGEDRLISVQTVEEIPSQYRETPVGRLLEYHNMGRAFEHYEQAALLIGMCMDYRKTLHIPERFAYVIRTGGGNLRYNEFQVSYALTLGGVSAIALIAHTDCGMVNLTAKKARFIDGLVEKLGWNRAWAEDHFVHLAPMYELVNEQDFVLSEAKRLRDRYPGVLIAPLLYRVEDDLLYVLEE